MLAYTRGLCQWADMSENKLTALNPAYAEPLLRDDRAYSGLTVKQWQYCEARAKGASVTEAYRLAYQPAETVPASTVQNIASQTENNLKIQARIRARLLELNGDTSGLPVIGREFVITGIASLAVSGQKETTRLRGYELLGKALGLFDRGPEQLEAPKTVNDIDARLRDLLRGALGPGPVIDGELVPDDTPPLGPDAPLAEEAPAPRKRKPRTEA